MYAVQVRDNATDNVVVAEEALRVGRVQLDLGKLAPFEVTRLEAGLVQARSFALDAEVQEQAASNTLLLLMGESPTSWSCRPPPPATCRRWSSTPSAPPPWPARTTSS